MRRLFVVLAVMCALGVPAGSFVAPVAGGVEGAAPAVVPVGRDFRISGGGAVDAEFDPALAWNAAAGEYLVVWRDHRTTATGDWQIYGRRVSAAGARIGKDFRISSPRAVSYVATPAVACSAATGECLVAWSDHRDFRSRGEDIYGRRVSAAGAPVGRDFRISSPRATANEWNPVVVWNATRDEFLVAWRDTRGADSAFFGQRVSATGAPIGRDFLMGGARAVDAHGPQVAWNASRDEYLVVWADARHGEIRSYDVYGQRVSGTGSRLGRDFRISSPRATGWEDAAVVAWNADRDEYLVVWDDNRDEATRGRDLYGQRVSAAGDRMGRDFRISSPRAIAGEYNPVVVWDRGRGDYLVVWGDSRGPDWRCDRIYGKRVPATGPRIGSEILITGRAACVYPGGGAMGAQGSASGRYLVVWLDQRDETTRQTDVYGRRLRG